jgi:hypothetical protein
VIRDLCHGLILSAGRAYFKRESFWWAEMAGDELVAGRPGGWHVEIRRAYFCQESPTTQDAPVVADNVTPSGRNWH